MYVILGFVKSIGVWQEKVFMIWIEVGWVVDLEGDFGEIVEYKYIIVIYDGGVIWEEGFNCIILLFDEGDFEFVIYWGCMQEDF